MATAAGDARVPGNGSATMRTSSSLPPYVHGRVYPAAERISPNIIPPKLPIWHASEGSGDVPAIVIDNGSSELRAGFALPGVDTPPLVFDSVISRYRDRKRSTNLLLVGSDAYVDTQSRSGIRRPFDMDVVCNYDVMESVFDFTFSRLGIESETVQHPILLTETLCNPAYTRAQMNEMLFECYGAPSVAYGLDALFSAYANDVENSLIVSSGRASTLVIPLVDRKALIGSSKRLNWGGQLATDYLLRLVQLKYPSFPLRVSQTQSAWMLEQFTFLAAPSTTSGFTSTSGADSYEEFIGSLPAPYEKKMEAQRPPARGAILPPAKPTVRPLAHGLAELDRVVQFPFTESEQEARRAAGEDVENGEQPKRNPSHFAKKPKPPPGEEPVVEEEIKVPSFPLVDVPDHQLDEEGVKDKRRQRLMKAGYDARMRVKAAKDEQARTEEEERRKDEDQRTNAFEQWKERKRKEYEDAIERIKERKRNQEMLSDRKSLVAQQRMKAITTMASEHGMGAAGGAGGGAPSKKRRRNPDDDGFGMDDSDWAIYREVHGQDEEEEEEEEQAAVASIEATLLKYDTSFTQDDTFAAREERKTHLTTTFLRGHWPAPWNPDDSAQIHQLHLNVERIRVPEVLFQPSLAGVDQAGLDELCAHVLRNLDAPVRDRLAKNIFITGQHTLYPGFDDRLLSSIRATQPIGTQLELRRARDVRFDPWRGMARWARECREELMEAQVTRAEYEEKGSEWFKEFRFSGCQL